MTLRIHSEPETGTAKLLKRAVSYENHVKAICRKSDYARKAKTDEERRVWLNEVQHHVGEALAALGEAKP